MATIYPPIANGSFYNWPNRQNGTILPETETLPGTACLVCLRADPFLYFRLPCGHTYCIGCLTDLFRHGVSQFPARCCWSLSIQNYVLILPPSLVELYQEKEEEFGCVNPLYCHHRDCGAFIPPRRIFRGVGTCRKCGRNTCDNCRRAAHEGRCTVGQGEDEMLMEYLGFAYDNGWGQCSSCGQVVTRDEGCSHITCRCGADFCYFCGASEMTCVCEYYLVAGDDLTWGLSPEEKMLRRTLTTHLWRLNVPDGPRRFMPEAQVRDER
ncbi:hypothetical protein F5Y01DRAFT_15842 [Xylaria sp. FL0043]|nr:hypothetical protein F5Y01DRAFT_15842 [Xylaria sp. FL0043]